MTTALSGIQTQIAPNARLLCCKTRGLPLGWESSLAQMAQYIECSPQLNLAKGGRGQALVIFDHLPGGELAEITSTFGLEVYGHESLPLSSPYQLLDLDRSPCYTLSDELSLHTLSLPQLLTTAMEMAQKLAQNEISLAQAWRVVWDRTQTPGQGGKKHHIDIQFFPEL